MAGMVFALRLIQQVLNYLKRIDNLIVSIYVLIHLKDLLTLQKEI